MTVLGMSPYLHMLASPGCRFVGPDVREVQATAGWHCDKCNLLVELTEGPEGKAVSEEVVTEFVAAYTREFDYYQAAARLCSQRCEALLGPRGFRAIVTYRAKRPIKLLAKLRERDQKQNYASSQDIREDIADLEGVPHCPLLSR